jgi:plasmid replication initiation protein
VIFGKDRDRNGSTKTKTETKKVEGQPKPGLREFGLAVLHNELARCNADIGVVAFRLIMMLAEKVHRDGEIRAVRFKVTDYIEKLQLSGKSAYDYLDDVILCLMRTIIHTPNAVGGQHRFQVLGPSDTDPGRGEFEIRFNDEMRPLLLNLRAHFAQIPLPIFFRIQGSYAVRFYLFCKSWDPALNYSPGWRMTVAELRAWLGIKQKEYSKTFHLRAAVIERAKNELDQAADVSFQYDAVMSGKKVIGWDFVPVPNKPRSKALPAKQRELKRQQKEDEETLKANEVKDAQRRDERKRIDTMWLEAGPPQRQTWLDAMSEQSRIFAPKPGARPSQVFLTALQAVVEPALPGFN